jgi:xanthine dehydrogenase large subunit
VQLAWFDRVSLSATGFYKTPKINYDRSTFSGRPFFYYAYGAAVSEVVVDTLTGENRILRVDIVHDCGDSLNPAMDLGQVEGGFVQGAGWLTSEELWWNHAGELQTHAPSRSKAVGEPPLMLAISVFHAIRDAIATDSNPRPALDAPATPEAVLGAIEEARA